MGTRTLDELCSHRRLLWNERRYGHHCLDCGMFYCRFWVLSQMDRVSRYSDDIPPWMKP